LYGEIPRVPRPVLLNVTLVSKSWIETLAYCQDPSNGILFNEDSRIINNVAYEIEKARPNYSSLMNFGMNQDVLEENLISEEVMREAFRGFDREIWQEYGIWAELMDLLPEKRIKGLELPEGKNAVLYRGVKISGESIDVSDAECIPVTVPEEGGTLTEELGNVLGANTDTYHFPGFLDFSKERFDGLVALRWAFENGKRPDLSSAVGISIKLSRRGALASSRLSAEEIIKVYRKSAIF